jgi:Ser/Thr protein kinase RdoA (MazF antagonist)
MAIFPVLDSIVSPYALALFVQKKYKFSANTKCKILKTGINHSYLVSDNANNYVLRVYSYKWRTENEILEEIKLLNLLRENHISISYPLLDSAGNYIQKIDAPEGLRYAVLFTFAEGDKIRNLTEENCRKIGLLMAKFHKLSVNRTIDRIDYNAKTLTQLPYQYALEHFPENMEEMQFVKAAGEYVTLVFQQADTKRLRHGIVHLDMWYDNMNIDENSKITVFDFDFCGNGWLLLDIAYFIMQLFHTEPDKDKFKIKLQSFYNGYEEVTSISDEEKKLFPIAGLAIWIFYLGVQSRRFDNWSNFFLTKNYLKHFIGIVKSWLNYNEVAIEDTEII